ncbi:phosphotransferase [Alicyclobacillus kakegawensis]|uniref:phosphotransferase n=1 Tax=Alicyclobacillus kakegawensis TaxID=392012 RepID=UPI00083001EB|nr:phosphotransferase [Alicyclobacillus kakegawensis]
MFLQLLFLGENEGTLSAVIDSGDVHLGHPPSDLAAALAYSVLPERARAVFWRVYGRAPEARYRR